VLVFLQDLGMQYPNTNSLYRARYGLYKCHCGKETVMIIKNVKCGLSKSCGCMEKTQKKKSKHRIYAFWRYIINNKLNICEEWLNIENFINDMDSSYKVGLRLKRIDEDKPYSKNNCIWIAKKEKVKKEVEVISDYKGVSWNKLKNKWVTRIDVYGKLKTIGYFEDKFDAAWAYDKYIIDNYLPHSTNFVH